MLNKREEEFEQMENLIDELNAEIRDLTLDLRDCMSRERRRNVC